MKRLFVLMFVIALAAAIPMSHDVFAAKAEAVTICHGIGIISNGGLDGAEPNCVTRFGDTVPEGRQCGIIIEVNGNAAGGHCGHGDRGVVDTTPGRCTPSVREPCAAAVCNSNPNCP